MLSRLCILLILFVLAVPAGPRAADNRPGFLKSFYRVDVLASPMNTRDLFFSREGDAPPLQMTDLRGKWVILNLWATWCAPCIRELPTLHTLSARLGMDRVVLTVSVDRKLDIRQIRYFLDHRGLEGIEPLHDSAGALERKLDTGMLPVTYVIDSSGDMRAALYGPADWSSVAAMDFIDNLPGYFPISRR